MAEAESASDPPRGFPSATGGDISLARLVRELTGRVRRGAGRQEILECILAGTATLTGTPHALLLELATIVSVSPTDPERVVPFTLATYGPERTLPDTALFDWRAASPAAAESAATALVLPRRRSDAIGPGPGAVALAVDGGAGGGSRRVLVAVGAGVATLAPGALATLDAWAGVTAVALAQLALHDEEDELRQVALALTESLDLDVVLARVLAAVRALIGTDWASIALVGEHTGFVARHYSTLQSGRARWYESTSQLRPGGVSRRVLERREPHFVADLARDPAANAAILDLGVRAVATLPMIAGGDTVGLLYANYARPHAFTAHEGELLGALAAQAAVAIRNAELYSALRRSEGELRTVLENYDAAICLTDGAGRVRYANRAFGELVGLAPERLVGREARATIEAAIGPLLAAPASFFARLAALDESAEAVAGIDLELAGPEPRILFHASSPARDEAGRPIGRVQVYRDITEYRRLQRVRDDFLAVAAHELRTPLSVIRAHTRVLKHWLVTPGSAAGDHRPAGEAAPHDAPSASVRTIEEQGAAMSAMVAQFLDVVRLGRAAPAGEVAPVDLVDLLARAVEGARATTDRHTVTLRLPAGAAPAAPTLVCRGNAIQLARVLTNLLDNAIKYSPAGGPIVVEGRRDGAEALLTVRDEGLGLSAEQSAGLFTRYHQAHDARAGRRQHYGGLGLGLYLCKEIVERHGGRIRAESAGPGRGATFSVALPLAGEGLSEDAE